jgi:hypothetical protein
VKEADLPTAAKQSLVRMDAMVLQARKKAVAELTSIMSTETRAGRLDVAMRVNDTVKAIAAEIAEASSLPSSKKASSSLPGKWRMHNTVLLTLESDNTFSAAGGNFKWAGTWRTENGKLVVDSTVFVDTYDLPPQRETRDGKTVWTLKGKNSKNEPVSMAKEE